MTIFHAACTRALFQKLPLWISIRENITPTRVPAAMRRAMLIRSKDLPMMCTAPKAIDGIRTAALVFHSFSMVPMIAPLNTSSSEIPAARPLKRMPYAATGMTDELAHMVQVPSENW